MSARRSPKDAGAALVLTLSLVALLSLIALVAVEAAAMGVRRTQNLNSMAQARWLLNGAEALSRTTVDEIKRAAGRGQSDPSDWQGRPMTFPLDDGAMTVTLWDGSNCFNLNSLILVDEGGNWTANVTAQVQLARLIAATGQRADGPLALAVTLTDWIDPDGVAGPNGGEDEAYLPAGRRAANAKLGDVGELRGVRGFTPELIEALSHSVCVRPSSAPNTINPNTLRLDQAGFLAAMVGPALPLSSAEGLLRRRPRGGWSSLDDFFAEPAMAQANLSPASRATFALSTRYFVMGGAVEWRETRETVQSLIDAESAPRIVRRVYGVPTREPVL